MADVVTKKRKIPRWVGLVVLIAFALVAFAGLFWFAGYVGINFNPFGGNGPTTTGVALGSQACKDAVPLLAKENKAEGKVNNIYYFVRSDTIYGWTEQAGNFCNWPVDIHNWRFDYWKEKKAQVCDIDGTCTWTLVEVPYGVKPGENLGGMSPNGKPNSATGEVVYYSK
jgi:hypothetical protein